MLKKLINGAEESSLIIFSVGEDCTGVELVNEFSKQSVHTAVVLTDPLDSVRAERTVRLIDKLELDAESGPIRTLINTQFDKSETVIVKSVSGLLQIFAPVAVARWLKYIQGCCKRVLAVLDRECVEEETYNQIIKLASTLICIQQGSTKDQKLCYIIHRKPGGKIQRSKELFFFRSGEFVIEPFTKTLDREETVKHIADSLTTFNLGTKDSEEEARRGLVLPFYTEEQKKGFQGDVKESGERNKIQYGEVKVGGDKNKIYYEPDSGDDWDDEDPDDDLDI